MPTLEEAFPATDSAPQQRVSLEQAFPQQRVSLEQAFPKASAPVPASGLASDAIQSHLSPPTGIRGAVNSFIGGEGGAGLKLLQGAESIQNMMNGGAVAEMMGAPSTRVFTPERVRTATQTLEQVFPAADTKLNRVSRFGGELAPGVAAALVAPEAAIPILTVQGAAGGAANAEDIALNAREMGHPVSPVREKLGVAGGAVAGGALNAATGKLMGIVGEEAGGPVSRIVGQGLLGVPQTVGQNIQQNVTAKVVDPQSKWQQPTPAELGENVLTNTAFAVGGELHGLAARAAEPKVSLEQAFPAPAESSTRSEQGTSAAPSPQTHELSPSQSPTAPDTSTPSAEVGVESTVPLSNTSPSATSARVIPQETKAAIGKSLTTVEPTAPEIVEPTKSGEPISAALRLKDGRIVETGAFHTIPANVGVDQIAEEGFSRGGKFLTREEAKGQSPTNPAEGAEFEPEQPPDLQAMSLPQLRKVARQRGVTTPSAANGKQQLIDWINNTGNTSPRLSGGRQAGAVVLPDVEPLVREARAGAAAIRSEYKPIAIRFGEEPAQHLNRMAAAPNETNSIEASFRRNAFGDDSATYGKFIELGQHFRGEELESRGKSRGNLPKLTPAEVAARMADPKIKKAIDLYNRDVGPFIEGIRTRNAMAMNPNAKSQPFFLNLVGDMEEPSYGGETAASFNKPFNRTATGSGTYETDPITYMRRVIGAHVRADANAQFKGWVKSKGLPFASLTPVQEPGKPTKFMGKWNGRDVEMTPVDVNQGLKMPVIDPTTKKPVTMASGAMVMTDKTPDMRYVPTAIADKAENIFQRQGPRDTLVDRAMQIGTRLGLTLRGAGHIQRNVAAVAARMSQNPRSIRSFLPSWLGNKGLAAQTMAGMAGTPLGDAMQVGVDRSGGARGTGFNVPEATSTLGKVANLTHDAIMHPVYGSDPNGRRVLANEFYRLTLDQPAVDAAQKRIAAGESPLKVGDELWNKLTLKQKLDMGQYINTTMGFLNSQSRSAKLNRLTDYFPFAGSEAGMIPNELSRFLSGNVSPRILKASIQRGQYGRAAMQLGGQLASGPVGIFLAMQALNLAGSGINGHPRFTWDNDEGHKLDVELPFTHSGNKNGYVSNLAPDFARASRLLGAKALANKDVNGPGELARTLGREGVNEAFSALAPTIRQVLAISLGKEFYWDRHGKQPDAQIGGGAPLIGHTIQSMQRGQGAGVGMAQDVAALAGYNVTQSSGKNYTPAQRLAHDILQQNSGGFQLNDEQRQRHADRQSLIESIRATPDKTGVLMQQALKDGKIPRSEAMSIIRESRRGDLENAIEQMSAEQAMQVYDAGSDDEKKKIKVLVQQKVYRAKTLTPQKKRELMQQIK